MATLIPDGWKELGTSGAAQREMQTLELLARGLPNDYTVLHAVHWTRMQHGHQVFGEVDFVVIGPGGRVLLIEQKSGFLDETAEGLTRIYGARTRSVPEQMARTAAALDARLRQHCPARRTPLESLLYCPDYTVHHPGTAGLDPERIVDARNRDRLCAIIRGIVGVDEPADPARADVLRFFAGLLDLVPDVGAIADEATLLYTRLSGGLAAWARRIECVPHRLRVTATAGSGKTQLALAVYRDALAAGRRPLYVCYNRPLADHIALIVPPGGEVMTYHQLCDRAARAQGVVPDFSRRDAFAALEAQMDRFQPPAQWTFDELIVDEGQDFADPWATNLLRLLGLGGRAWWLEDPMQNLYGRAPVRLPGWVGLKADTNYRSPRDVLEKLNHLLAPGHAIEAGSPLTGSEVEVLTWKDGADLLKATTRAVTHCIGLGFKRDMIAIVTYRGREHSAFTPLDRLGPYMLRSYTGQYDLLGSPERADGDIAIDSVHRFKGQSAPCVVFTEIDFETLDDLAIRRIFVGATRASMKLVLVVSERAAPVLSERMG